MIFVDGVYVTEGASAPVFRAVRSTATAELQALVQQLAERIGQAAIGAGATCGSRTAGSVSGAV